MVENANSERPMPPRLIHLIGGLRAVDAGVDKVFIQTSGAQRLLEFATPNYAQLYAVLRRFGLPPIGVEFLRGPSLDGLIAPGWQSFFPKHGFRLMDERQAWAEIRHLASRDGNGEVVKIASKCVTYLDLLNIRLRQLSNAYNGCLRESWAGEQKYNRLFSNSYMGEIDAAIHAFVADTASFRDVISEIVWRFVLNEKAPITRFSSFRKNARDHSHELAQELLEAGRDDSWLGRFSMLRNNITHVAPVGRSQTFHFCEVRAVKVGPSASAPSLHYPVLARDGTLWQDNAADLRFSSDNEDAIKSALEGYREYLVESVDGLTYAWELLERIGELLTRVRLATGLRGEMPHITDADIIGEIRRL